MPIAALDLLAVGEADERALPVGLVAPVALPAARLALADLRADRHDLHAPDLLDGGLDLDLVGPHVDLERVHVRALGHPGHLLGDDRALDHLECVEVLHDYSAFALSVAPLIAPMSPLRVPLGLRGRFTKGSGWFMRSKADASMTTCLCCSAWRA